MIRHNKQQHRDIKLFNIKHIINNDNKSSYMNKTYQFILNVNMCNKHRYYNLLNINDVIIVLVKRGLNLILLFKHFLNLR